ncbi:MAG: GNAT family N-acetyltransferase [Ilumatobacteraceae bacterium]|nr:GNAT family N-acetyltransferase [Ilumatobacteraceae bacterium]
MSAPLTPITLEGRFVRLLPLTNAHVRSLLSAAAGSRESFQYTWVPEPTTADITRYISAAVAAFEAGTAHPFVTVRIDSPDTVVGSTRFLNLEYWPDATGHPSTRDFPDAVEIGATWLSHDAQRTQVNTEAKLMMLTYAFETWGVQRVVFRTDARNTQSRANIERIGAQYEGTLRHHKHSTDGANNGLRDTATYSIIREEWDSVKASLQVKLAE